jgi:hypothetical protein
MNQSESESAPVESTPASMPYKDRSMGLSVFGTLTILLGCLAGLFGLYLWGKTAIGVAARAPDGFSTILPGLFLCGILAVALVWLGVGSIMARRWARALLLILSWCCLVFGVLLLVFAAFFLPHTLANMTAAGTAAQPASNARLKVIVIAVMLLFLGVFAVIVPVVWIFFYNSRHVKATCEMRDPVPRWTDACPLPVLGFCVFLMVNVPLMLLLPVSGDCVVPFFGMFLTGIPGALGYLAFASIWFYAAWSLYKLQPLGWWLIFIALLVWMVSAILTYPRLGMMEMYRLMNYSDAHLEHLQEDGLLTGNPNAWLMSLSNLPLMAYLLFIKKFLRRSGDQASPQQIPVASCQ